MTRNLAILLLAFLLASEGCKPKAGLVGEWSGTQPTPIGGVTNVYAKFNKDGTYQTKMGAGTAIAETDGDYTYDEAGKSLTMNAKKIMFGGKEVKIAGGTLPKGSPDAVTWKGDDELAIKLPVGEMDLKRK